MPTEDLAKQGFKWENRRRAVFLNIGFSMLMLLACLLTAAFKDGMENSTVLQTLINILGVNLLGTIFAYAFGAAVENMSLAKMLGKGP